MSDNLTVVWVGISLQKDAVEAFDEKFRSGKLIRRIEEELPDFSHVKTNLVDFAPLDGNGKLRYPTTEEIISQQSDLLCRIDLLKPFLVVAMGGLAIKHVGKLLDCDVSLPKSIFYDPKSGRWPVLGIHHPSYISVYKRNELDNYIKQVVLAIKNQFLAGI